MDSLAVALVAAIWDRCCVRLLGGWRLLATPLASRMHLYAAWRMRLSERLLLHFSVTGEWVSGIGGDRRPETEAQGMHQTASQTEKPKRTESFGRKLENTIIQRGTVAQTGNKWKCTARKCLKKANQFTTTNEKPLTFA